MLIVTSSLIILRQDPVTFQWCFQSKQRQNYQYFGRDSVLSTPSTPHAQDPGIGYVHTGTTIDRQISLFVLLTQGPTSLMQSDTERMQSGSNLTSSIMFGGMKI